MEGEKRYSVREAILDAARDAVMKDRNHTYGPPTQDFARTAAILNTLGFRIVNGNSIYEVMPHHVALIQIAVKLSRLTWSPKKDDSWVDVAGYAACGYECVVENYEKE